MISSSGESTVFTTWATLSDSLFSVAFDIILYCFGIQVLIIQVYVVIIAYLWFSVVFRSD